MVTTPQLLRIIGPRILKAWPNASFIAAITHPGHHNVSVWNVPHHKRTEVERAVLPLNHGLNGVRTSVALTVYSPTMTADVFAGTHNRLRRLLHGHAFHRSWVPTPSKGGKGVAYAESKVELPIGILEALRAIGEECPYSCGCCDDGKPDTLNGLGVKHPDTIA